MRNLSILWIALMMLVTACDPVRVSPPVASGTGAVEDPDALRVGDRIRVILFDIPTPPPAVEQVIPEDGVLTLHMNVQYKFAGKKRAEAEKDIAKIYTQDRKIYTRMTVVIEKQATFISIGGEVRSPSSIVHRGDLTVLSAIDAAGGFTPFADRTAVIVTRASNKQQTIVNAKKAIRDPSLNLRLFPGDSVYVQKNIL